MLVAIRGEAFDLSSFAPLHLPGNSVIPIVSILSRSRRFDSTPLVRTISLTFQSQRIIQQRYGGIDATSIFPVQVSALCNGVDGTLSPWVTMPSANTSNTNAVYHDFRAFTTDSRPDWYTESMSLARLC